MFKVIFSLFAMFLFSIDIAQAQVDIAVGQVQRYFLADAKPFQTLRVRNFNKETSFELEAKLDIYTNLDDHDRKETTFESVDNHFLFAPKRFVLGPASSRPVRLVRTEPLTDKERVYRLSFYPKDTSVRKVSDEVVNGVKPGMKINTTGGMLVWVSPKEVVFDVTFTRNEKGVTFYNKGNISTDMKATRKFCYKTEDGEGCIELPSKRIHPGGQWFFEVEPNIPLRWLVSGYEKKRKWLDIKEYE